RNDVEESRMAAGPLRDHLTRWSLPAAHHNNAAGERSEPAAIQSDVRCQVQLPVRQPSTMVGRVMYRSPTWTAPTRSKWPMTLRSSVASARKARTRGGIH